LNGKATRPDVGTQIGHAPLAKMVQSLAESIAQSQFDLDHTNALLARRFADSEDGENGLGIQVDGQTRSLMELGFTPTCYSIASAVLDIKMSVSMSTQTARPTMPTKIGLSGSAMGYRGPFSAGVQANVSFMAATSASKYQYKSEASSYVRTQLVSVPPPELLQERLENLRKKLTAQPRVESSQKKTA
jgi:hypothetical protein